MSALKARDEGTNARLAADVTDAFGPAMNRDAVEAGFQGVRERAGQAYGQATAQAGPVDTTDVLTLLGQRLTTAEGGERAALLKARGMLMGRDANGMPVPKSDARNLHAIKGELDNLISYGDPTVGVMPGTLGRRDGAVSGVRTALNDALEAQVPGYAEANLSARTAHRASEAMQSGRRTLATDAGAIHPETFAGAFDALPLEQQAALRVGVRSDIDQALGTRSNDLVALRREVLGDGDWNMPKLAKVFGEDEARRIMGSVDRETAFRDAYTKVVQGSQSAQRLAGAQATGLRSTSPGPADNGIAVGTALGGHAGAATAAAVKGARFGWNVIGREMDKGRNRDLSSALTMSGPDLAALVRSLDTARPNASASIGLTAKASGLAQALMQPVDRASDNRERAKGLGRALRQMSR